jgi:hypothetical protein
MVPTVQQSEFRSQWVGDQLDQIPLGGFFSPGSGLGTAVGSLETPGQLKKEVDATLASLNAPPPISVKSSLSLGWQYANQGVQSGSSSAATGPQSSSFAAPTIALLYDRDHGPWSVSAGYSGGYKYYANPNYTGAGSGQTRNPIAMTAFARAALQMDRYIFDTIVSASSGTGYDTTSASYNLQTTTSLSASYKYILTDASSVAAKAGYNFSNASGSTATPNNNTTTLFASIGSIYDYSSKTHLDSSLSAGRSTQGLQQGTSSGGNMALSSNTSQQQSYVQELSKVKYDFSDKMVFDLGLGARYLTSNITNSSYTGLRPSWIAGLGYTPTSKTSIKLGTGIQGTDVAPEFNLAVGWNPRAQTQVSLGVSQAEQFANSVAGQYIVVKGANLMLSQELFSKLTFSISAGYSIQNYVNLSNQTTPGQSTSNLPSNYYVAGASLSWKIKDAISLINSLTYNTGLGSGGSSSTSNNNQPQYTYSIALNVSL